MNATARNERGAKTTRERRSSRPTLEVMEGRQLLSGAPSYALSRGALVMQLNGRTTAIAGNVASYQVASDRSVYFLCQDGSLYRRTTSGASTLVDRTVRSFKVVAPGQVSVVDWFSANTRDSGVCSVARSLNTRDAGLSFNDMLSLFNQVMKDGRITTNEVRDLRTIVCSSSIFVPDYVRSLSVKVLYPSQNDLNYLTNYYAGGPSISTMRALVNQWFLGSVQPDTSSESFDSCRYTREGATGYKLFGPGGPSFADVEQRQLGDCWLLAGLAEVAAQRPDIISNMFINNGNGTWTVRFYVNGRPDYVTVNDQLPVNDYGNFVYDAPRDGVLWVALAEKAYAIENLMGGVQTGRPGSCSYGALECGFTSWSLAAITGWSSDEFSFPTDATSDDIADALDSGKLVCLGTPGKDAWGNLPDIDSHLAPGHAYAVVGYDPSSSYPFHVFNPWGLSTYGNTNGATWGQFWSTGWFLEENFVGMGMAGRARGAHQALGAAERDAFAGRPLIVAMNTELTAPEAGTGLEAVSGSARRSSPTASTSVRPAPRGPLAHPKYAVGFGTNPRHLAAATLV